MEESVSRVEAKHLVEEPQVTLLHKHVTPLLAADPHGPQYEVKSLYHDTPGRDCFHAAEENYPERFKIRSRQYNGKGDTFHELKARKGPLSLKRDLSPDEYQQAVKAFDLRPTVEVKYDREAYEDEVNGEPFRMTIDRGVRSREFGKKGWVDVFPGGTVVVELKTKNDDNRFARRVVNLAGLDRVQLSKFVASLRRLNG